MFGFDSTDGRMIFNLFKLNLKDKYLASTLGGIWAILNPIIMLSIFTFVFGFLYKAKLPGASTTLSYVVWLISGYGPWLAMSEGLLNAANSVVSNTGIVKNMAFKVEILPISSILVSIVPLLVSLFFLSIIMLLDGNIPTWHVILIIPVIVIMYFFMFGLGFFLSAVSVFLRDLIIVLPNLLMIILFLSPIFLDDVAYPKTGSGSWCNRVKLYTGSDQPSWFSMPIKRETGEQLIKEVCFSNKAYTLKKMSKTLAHSYQKNESYDTAMAWLLPLLCNPEMNLALYNMHVIQHFSTMLGLKTKFIKQSELTHSKQQNY
ncbi:MAG: WbqC family protein [Gammaproteobacteria bacterium]|nr:WbqC family protein [Gammaproteobacteria bacterium]MCH9764353.1 WbqC family protein [Gammaproteobacteria bacterium]